jgi:hypothetical protein
MEVALSSRHRLFEDSVDVIERPISTPVMAKQLVMHFVLAYLFAPPL